MVDITASTNVNAVLRRMNRLLGDTMPKVKSKAAEKAMQATAKDVAEDGKTALDNPIKAIFDGPKSRVRRGWIYMQWDDKTVIKRNRGNVQASIQLQGLGPAEARKQQQEALHRNIFGTSETDGVTPSIPFIIKPSQRLLRDKKLPGVPFIKIDRHGNIRNYQQNLRKMLNDPKGRFFQVKLGETGGGRNSNGIKLPPGLYFRKVRVRRYKTHSITRRRGGPYKGTAKKLETVSITTLLTYHRLRNYDKNWRFRENAQAAMRRRYSESFVAEFNRAVNRESRSGGR